MPLAAADWAQLTYPKTELLGSTCTHPVPDGAPMSSADRLDMDLALYCAQQAVVGAAGPVRLLAAKRVEAVDQSMLVLYGNSYAFADAPGVQILLFVRCVTARAPQGHRFTFEPCCASQGQFVCEAVAA
jgi:hypothetical protein